VISTSEHVYVDRAQDLTSFLVDEGLRAGLALLWRAYICAQATGSNPRDLALRTGPLYDAGMTSGGLRWMVAKGFAEHLQETPSRDGLHRSFNGIDGYFFNERSCLLLTPKGATLAEHVFAEMAGWPQAKWSAPAPMAVEPPAFAACLGACEPDELTAPVLKPHWNGARRELSWSGILVKRFRVPAKNQERILSVFEEDGWAEYIHDPLAVTYDIDAPTRLHDAINRLNRCQVNPLIRFHGDGRGTGVLWELRRPNRLA
jgi:hypothetical protein